MSVCWVPYRQHAVSTIQILAQVFNMNGPQWTHVGATTLEP
jgi:hypothetical protein